MRSPPSRAQRKERHCVTLLPATARALPSAGGIDWPPLRSGGETGMYDHGWYQVAFERDLAEEVNPLGFANRRWMGIKAPSGVRVLDATCPHRGAHLAFGGKVLGEVLRCPFHGHAIGLGRASPEGFEVREYPAVTIGGMVFAALSDGRILEGPDWRPIEARGDRLDRLHALAVAA